MQNKLRHHIEEVIPLTDDEFVFVDAHFSYKKAKKNEFLIQVGSNVKHVYFVVSGLLKLVYIDELGKEYIVAFAMEDWWESDYYAFYSQTAATMTLQCLEDTEVFCITLDDYHKLCNGFSKIEHFFLQKANNGHIASQQRILSLLSLSAKERYDFLLKRYPSLFQRVSKTLLASYLGVSRETLSRLSS